MELLKINLNIKLLKSILIIIFGSMALTISAKLKIPFYPVPMTMQTFVVLFLGVAFGYKIGVASVSLYLIEGISGLPVFSNSPEKGIGLIYFTGPTMGYLLGFLLASFLSGYLNLKENILSVFIKLTFAVSTIYLLGILWLGILIGWEKPIFKIGVQPFLTAELFKVLLLVFLIPILQKTKKIFKII